MKPETSLSGVQPGASPLPMGAPFMLITGGKGGVGKTTLSANLAVQLALQGRRVLLVDLDLGLANLNILMRLTPGPTLEDALEGRSSFSECVVEGPAGVHVLPASSGTAGMGRLDSKSREAILSGLGQLAPDYDVVLGDSSAGIGPDVLAFAAAADQVWVITTPQAAALTDAYGLIKALHAFGIQNDVEVPTPELVVNLAAGLEEAQRSARRLCAVSERFLMRRPRSGGWMPLSRRVAESVRRRRPFALERAPNSLESNCLRSIARRVGRFVDSRSATPAS